MNNAGRIIFGVKAQDNSLRTLSSGRAYNDNQWHQVTATMGSAGMALYVDGVRVGRRADTTAGEAYLGYWRVGGDNLGGWPPRPQHRQLRRQRRRGRGLPDRAEPGADHWPSTRPAAARPSIPPAPADALRRRGVRTTSPTCTGASARPAGPPLPTPALAERRHLPQRRRPSAPAGVHAPATGPPASTATTTSCPPNAAFSNPTVYSEEAWFKTTTNRGGKIIGFGNSQTGNSGSYDRHVYMQDDGRLVFGVWTGQTNTITTPSAYNDGDWHHVVATQSGTA